MGRKGSGRAGFFKASRLGPDADNDREEEASAIASTQSVPPARPGPKGKAPDEQNESAYSKKAATFLVGALDGGSDDSADDDGNERSHTGETRGQMTQRHKRETKSLKEQIKRLGKKGKDEAARLEIEMRARHEAELATLVPSSSKGNETVSTDALAGSLYSISLNEGGSGNNDEEKPAVGGKKPTKAQRRREQRAREEAEREARIAAEVAELGETERMVEERELALTLAPLGLKIKDIPPDGHCLYRSIEDQLISLSDGPINDILKAEVGCEKGEISYLTLRRLAANQLRCNAEEFRNFIGEEELRAAKELGAVDAHADSVDVEADPFDAYCVLVEKTAAWGGHLEIQALSQALKAHIRVYSVGMPVLDVGQEFQTVPTLQVCYLRHAYGLGEHYNSVEALGEVELQEEEA